MTFVQCFYDISWPIKVGISCLNQSWQSWPMITNITENASILQKRIFNSKIKLKLTTCDVNNPC